MARSTFATFALASVLGTSCTKALRVVSPSEGMTVVAETPFNVEWTGASEGMLFDIDLYYCDSLSFCFDDDCGYFLETLCPEGDAGCPTQDDGYEVVMPEPFLEGNGYRVRISEVDGDRVRCSDDFYLTTSDTGESPASITVLTPDEFSVALAGGEYTIEFDYDNGFGSSVGRFNIDLYESEGTEDCGTLVTSICDKPDMGCRDTSGDYDVTIPDTTESGMYRIRVGVFGDDSVYDCSEAFEVYGEGSWE